MTRPDVFAALTPEQIAGYLTKRGWVEVPLRWGPEPGWRAKWIAFDCRSHPEPCETQLPRESYWDDWGNRVRDCLAVVADCEARPTPAELVARAIAEEGKP